MNKEAYIQYLQNAIAKLQETIDACGASQSFAVQAAAQQARRTQTVTRQELTKVLRSPDEGDYRGRLEELMKQLGISAP